MLLTAARDSSSPPQGRNPELYAELAQAREAWHGALRDRGLLPYLLAQLGTTPRPPRPRPAGVSLDDAECVHTDWPVLEFDTGEQTSPESPVNRARDVGEVGLCDSMRWMHEQIGELAVVGQ